MKQQALHFLSEGNIEKAGYLLKHLVKSEGHDAELWHMLGVVNGQLELFEEAVKCSQRAVSINAEYTDAYFNLAQACMRLDQYAEAVSAYVKVLDKYPDHISALKGCGYACYELCRNEQALTYYGHALELAPKDMEILNNMGVLLRRLRRFGAAIEAFKNALKCKPDYVAAMVNLGMLMQRCSRHGDAGKLFRQAAQLTPFNVGVRSALVFNLNYHVEDPQLIYEEHAGFGQILEQGATNTSVFGVDADKGKVLRIGYISPDFRTHSVAYFMRPILECHNPGAVESICYSDVRKPDSMTGRLRKEAGKWRDIAGMSTADVDNLIRKDRIDILVDLAGHTGDNRLRVFAGKPAPVQVSYLGYPNTTGLSAIDYRLTDSWADPSGTTERYHTEELVRLPNGFICYQPPEGLPAVSDLPALDLGCLTFGSFNNLAKITPDVVALWAKLLHAVPVSRLILKNRLFKESWAREHFLDQFRKSGVEEDRVQLHGFLSRHDHFSLYRDVDIALDTFPYSGTTTMCESLWMGVPNITLAGQMHAGRVGVSILHQVGLTDWIAGSSDEYIDVAVDWSKRLGELSALRMSLRDQMAESRLCNAQVFVQGLESLYRSMWERYLDKNTNDL